MTGEPIRVALPDAELIGRLGPMPGVSLVEWDWQEPRPADVDVFVPPYMSDPVLLRRLEGSRPRLVQSQSIGFDRVDEHLPTGIPFANAATVHETSTAEHAIALALALQRELPAYVHAQGRGEWAPIFADSLADRRVLIVGYGGVGRAIEDRLLPFEVEITRVARTARDDADRPIHAFSELPELLPDAEIVILAVPLTEETRHSVDAAFLSRLRDGAALINVSRGPVVDTSALLAELRRGRIRAAVDVVDPEPLPADHPLWSAPGLLITPHVGGASSAMKPRMARLLRRQIERLRAGEAPLNLVLG